MDFTLTKEQQDIIKAAREFASGEFPERHRSLIGTSPLIWTCGGRHANSVLLACLSMRNSEEPDTAFLNIVS